MSDAEDPHKPAAGRPRRARSAAAEDDGEQETTAGEEAKEPRVCVPCHGAGKVISNLGGHATRITCPWCRGSGERLTGVDAQEFQQEQAASKRR
jgi:DnaJ-class molecular chaperone